MEKYKYDIAISFANEDLNIALCFYLALKLKHKKGKVFYYRENLDNTGQHLEKKLPINYGVEAKYVIMLVSKNYLNKQKEYAQIEKNAIMERWKKEENTFLIPVIIDDVKLSDVDPELTKDVLYLKWEYEPEQQAKLIWKMLGKTIDEAKKVVKNYYGDKVKQGKNSIYAERDVIQNNQY